MTERKAEVEITARQVLIMWIADVIIRNSMGSKITTGQMADHLLKELDKAGYAIIKRSNK